MVFCFASSLIPSVVLVDRDVLVFNSERENGSSRNDMASRCDGFLLDYYDYAGRACIV